MTDNRVSTEQLAKAIREFMKSLPPVSEQDIELIKMNPSLSFIQKLRIIRKMRKSMKLNTNFYRK